MGRLLCHSDFQPDGPLHPSWYYDDGIESGFPYQRAIHFSHFGGSSSSYPINPMGELKRKIRQFIEVRCIGNCYRYEIEKDYSYLVEVSEKHRSLYDYCAYQQVKIFHRYTLFNFEYEEDAVLFEMAFSEVDGISDRYPGIEVKEESISLVSQVDPYKVYRSYY